MDVTATVWTLLPPIIAIALALITKEVYSSLMIGMPKSLTAATGMDALTHAIEAYVSIAATPITDDFHHHGQ